MTFAPERLAEIEALAKAAKDSWFGSTPGWYDGPDEALHVRPEESPEDLALIVALSPDVVAALVREALAGRALAARVIERLNAHGHIENHGHRCDGSTCGECKLVNEIEAYAALAGQGT